MHCLRMMYSIFDCGVKSFVCVLFLSYFRFWSIPPCLNGLHVFLLTPMLYECYYCQKKKEESHHIFLSSLPFIPGCDPYTLTREQLRQKEQKRLASELCFVDQPVGRCCGMEKPKRLRRRRRKDSMRVKE